MEADMARKPIKVAAICGSLRKGSYNALALKAASELAPDGFELDILRLNAVEPYDGDVEEKGWPPGVKALRQSVEPADAVLFATPEYNYSVPGVLKNAIDWLSRPERKSPIFGKPAGMIGASTSKIGTARAQADLRSIVFYNGMPLFAGGEVLIMSATDKFDDKGRLVDEKSRELLAEYMLGFAEWVRLVGGKN
jgi:chromate reductase